MLGDLQLSVMEVIWSRDNATVSEIHQELSQDREIAYTTVLSTVQSLQRRSFLRHTKEGKAHRFHALISRESYTNDSVDHLLERLFAGQKEALMSHLLGSEKLNKSGLERIKNLLAEEGE